MTLQEKSSESASELSYAANIDLPELSVIREQQKQRVQAFELLILFSI